MTLEDMAAAAVARRDRSDRGAASPLVIEDAREHPLVRDSLANRDLGVVADAGVPLITRAGHALGTLCVIDRKPRSWTSEQIETLKTLGAAALAQIELRVASQPA